MKKDEPIAVSWPVNLLPRWIAASEVEGSASTETAELHENPHLHAKWSDWEVIGRILYGSPRPTHQSSKDENTWEKMHKAVSSYAGHMTTVTTIRDWLLHAATDDRQAARSSNWAKLAEDLMARLRLDNRMLSLEKQLGQLTEAMRLLKSHCEKVGHGPIVVPVSTFGAEPFEIAKDLNIVVRPEDDCFVATLFDANLSSAGDTPEEAVSNLKELILMVIKGFEQEPDEHLGPMMRRQKHALFDLVRRK